MKIVDTYSDILLLFDSMNNGFDIALWEAYANQISSGLPQKIKEDSSGYNFRQQVLPVIRDAMSGRETLEKAHDSFLAATERLGEKFASALGVDLQVDIIFYLGLCNGAGWATRLDGKSAVLIGVEKILELNWHDCDSMLALIYHELGHIWHDTVGALHQETKTGRDKSVLQLYQEGVATYIEQLLTGDFLYYHRRGAAWLDWCNTNRLEISAEYLRRLNADESTQDFFGDWRDYRGYSDAGYYIGCEFIKQLAGKYSLSEIANLNINAVYDEFGKYAKQTRKIGRKKL